MSPSDALNQYRSEGYVICPPILDHTELERVRVHIDLLQEGKLETPSPNYYSFWKPGDNPTMLRKLDNPHLVDSVIHQTIRHPNLGKWAAALHPGCKLVQVWAVQLLYKPPGDMEKGSVGWHQDQDYWSGWWKKGSTLFTAWVGISDVPMESGPMLFARKSHEWGHLDRGDFFGQNLEATKQKIRDASGQPWEEAPDVMPAGGVSFHHRLTVHGSRPNQSAKPRISFAIHLRTEDSWPAETPHFYNEHLDDEKICPVIWRA